MLFHIHRYLFQDLDQAVYAPGIYKAEQLVEREYILNGDSVLYGAPEFIEKALAMFFAAEAGHAYSTALTGSDLDNLASFISHIWQVHPFKEGNTGTVAVFAELYLDYLGFDIDNGPFADNARYFRNALVRTLPVRPSFRQANQPCGGVRSTDWLRFAIPAPFLLVGAETQW